MPRRHALNNTAAPIFTYEERRKLGIWGTQKVRAGADAIKQFDACTLCLNQATQPLLCPKGHLFCKACIFEHLLTQKQFQKKQLSKYQQQRKHTQDQEKSKEENKKLKAIELFDKAESSILPANASQSNATNEVPLGYEAVETTSGVAYMVDKEIVKAHSISASKLSEEEKEKRKRILPCFWVPNLTPDAGHSHVDKPISHTVCPEGFHILRLKQLRPVHFTLVTQIKHKNNDSDNASNTTSNSSSNNSSNNSNSNKSKSVGLSQYMCSGCRKTLTNATKSTSLNPCGHVICFTCVQRLVAKDKSCPDCGEVSVSLTNLQLGGTGFAAHGASTISAKPTPAFQC